MGKWYLVKQNVPVIATTIARYGKEYIGLGGDIWPCTYETPETDALYRELEKSRSYVRHPDAGFFYVHQDIDMVRRYFDCPAVRNLPVMLVEVCFAEDAHGKVDGYDFGHAGGGYSVIETEIILKDSKYLIDRFLNKFGLFDDRDSLNAFLSDLKDAEECDSYCAVAIKALA